MCIAAYVQRPVPACGLVVHIRKVACQDKLLVQAYIYSPNSSLLALLQTKYFFPQTKDFGYFVAQPRKLTSTASVIYFGNC